MVYGVYTYFWHLLSLYYSLIDSYTFMYLLSFSLVGSLN